jgi:hypothetical protein
MRRTLSLACAVAFAAALTFATTAAAAPVPSPKGEYCAVHIEPIGSPAPPATPVCFETQSDVDAYLDAVTGKPEPRSAAPAPSAPATTASVVLGTVYKDAGYAGGSLSFYGSGPCSGVTYGFPSLDPTWQNTISSAKAFASCWVSLYTGASYGGSQLLCTPNCATLGSFNDRILSLVFRPAG